MKQAYLAAEDRHYKKLGITKEPAAREDGMRTDGQSGSFEWWYFDVEYENGMKIVVGFYTKKQFDLKGPANPSVTFELTSPDGEKYTKFYSEGKRKTIRASKQLCDVKIGRCFARYEGGDYIVHYEDAECVYDCRMRNKVPMWRPGTGFDYYGRDEQDYFAWFVAQPSAEVTGSLTRAGKTEALHGNGYHDHNWGNISMDKIMNHWYWCRASVGPYSVICSDIISEKKYGNNRIVHFMLAKDGQIISGHNPNVKVERRFTEYHPVTGKFIDNDLLFIFTAEDGTEYMVQYLRDHDMMTGSLLELAINSKLVVRILKRFGVNPTYMRIIGNVKITIKTPGGETTTSENEGLWEQMFFGSNKDAVINE